MASGTVALSQPGAGLGRGGLAIWLEPPRMGMPPNDGHYWYEIAVLSAPCRRAADGATAESFGHLERGQ